MEVEREDRSRRAVAAAMHRWLVLACHGLLACCAVQPAWQPPVPEVPARWRDDPLLAENYLDGYRHGYDATMAWMWTTCCRRGPVEPAVRAWDKGWYDAFDDAFPVFYGRLDDAIDRRDRDALVGLFRARWDRDLIVEQIVAGWEHEGLPPDTATDLPLR